MKKLIALILISNFLSACGETQTKAEQDVQPAPAPQVAVKEHNYNLKDGLEYGYEPALSDEARKTGKAVEEMLMFKYAGKRDNVYQVYTKEGAMVTVAECTAPCEFAKLYVFYNNKFQTKKHMRLEPGILIGFVIEDAQNGKLEQSYPEIKGKKNSIWFSEKGIEFTPAEK